jgi:predicted unusual protein kinase regulating ubiquinone biosynthesis (AarF/ABC1/UbiB family)
MKLTLKLFSVVMAVHLLFGARVFAGQRSEKPLYLSYEQRLTFSYLLAGSGESRQKQLEIADRMAETLRRWMRMPTQTIVVDSFDQFLKAYQGPWPNSYSLESDLSLIETSELRGPIEITAATPELQAQIDGFLKSQNLMLAKKSVLLASGGLSSLASLGFPNPRELLSSESRQRWILSGFEQASRLLESNLQLIQQTGADIAQSGKLAGSDQAMSLFMTTAFREYFGRLSLATKKQIISQIVGHDLNMNLQQRFELMILCSGPQFQKLLQVVARDAGVSEDLLKVFKQLESKAAPIPPPIVKSLFEAERDRYHWISYDLQPLGTGTMAQVHRGKINLDGRTQDVVIRFLKPEIEKRVVEDHQILQQLATVMDSDPSFRQAGFPKLGPVVDDLNRTVTDELDLAATVERQQEAKKIYSRDLTLVGHDYKNVLQIAVPDVYEFDPSSKLQVQELVAGEKLDQVAAQYQEAIPDLKKSIVEAIARLWLDEVLFGSGFFHSDLHQGNFMVDFTDPKVIVNMLDFGMGGTISHAMQSRMMEVGAGIDLNRADLIAEGFWLLSEQDQNTLQREDFEKKVAARVQEIAAGRLARQSVNSWTAWSMDEGLRFPYEFVSLNRGLVILDKLLKDAGSPLSMDRLARQVGMDHAGRAFWDLRSTKRMSLMDFIKLGFVTPSPAPQVSTSHAMTGSSLECKSVFLQDRSSSLEGMFSWTGEAF